MQTLIADKVAEDFRPGIAKTLIVIFVFMALMLGLMVNKVMNPAPLTVEQFRERGVFLFEPARKIKDFELINHKAQAFTKADLKGQWSLLFFGFTHCPDVCPTTLAMLNQVMAETPEPAKAQDTQVILVTVDPARDTVAVLNQYMPYFNQSFIGLTGDFLKILSFSGNLTAPFRKVVNGDDYSMDHSAYIFLINPRGDLQGFIKPPFDATSFAANYTAIRKKYVDHF
ncbi:MAG: SCO family protein [Pseudomonadales bacterium]|nr:SCO family protein [Pseudomonadales bacterium]